MNTILKILYSFLREIQKVFNDVSLSYDLKDSDVTNEEDLYEDSEEEQQTWKKY